MSRSWLVAALGGVALITAPLATTSLAAGIPPQATWNFDQARVPAARSAGHDGSGVVVAVVDSWVDGAHKDFEGRVLAGADCVGGTCKDGPAASDQCDHGTHVAGTIASSSFGVAPKATILPVRVLTYDSGSASCVGQRGDVANGIRWAVAHGAKVVNLSLGADVPGLSGSTVIPDAVAAAAQAGVVVIFSAGNADLPVADSYSGNALVVAATGPDGQIASYSQHGSGVDLAAPGGDPRTKDVCHQDDCITSLYPGNRYAVAAGTSMAAPHVSGTAALLLAQQPGRGRQQVLDRLTSTARPLAGAGGGLLDATAALGVHASAGPTPRGSPSSAPVAVVQEGTPRAPGPGVVAPARPGHPRASAPPPGRPPVPGPATFDPAAGGGAADTAPPSPAAAYSSSLSASGRRPGTAPLAADEPVPRAVAGVGIGLAGLAAVGVIFAVPRRRR